MRLYNFFQNERTFFIEFQVLSEKKPYLEISHMQFESGIKTSCFWLQKKNLSILIVSQDSDCRGMPLKRGLIKNT